MASHDPSIVERHGERPRFDGDAVLPYPYHPSEADVTALIVAASQHPLGASLLLTGHLGTVAIMFGVHAFVVDAARDRLRRAGN